MKIAIDARSLSHPQPGGFKTYTKNLVKHLAEIGGGNRYILYLDRPMNDVSCFSDVEVKVLRTSLPGLQMPIREQVWLRFQLQKDRPTLAHFPCATGPIHYKKPFVVTIYDVIEYLKLGTSSGQSTKLMPKRHLMHLYNLLVQARVARNASAVITVSQHSKNDIGKYLGIPSDKIFVTYLGHGLECQPLERSKAQEFVSQRFGMLQDFVLAIGSADPRKNISAAIEAFAKLEPGLRWDYELVIVWTHGHLREKAALTVKELGLVDRVRFLEGVSGEDLASLFSAASLFVFPSLYEGFGLPPLEAMAYGTPVIASNRSSIPEVVGDAAITVDPKNVEEMAAAIARALRDRPLREALAQKGLRQAGFFSWKRCATETLSIYEEVAERFCHEWQCVPG